MKLIVNISLSIILLFQSMNVHIEDILNIKIFFEHAQIHKEKYGDSFMAFLSKHYGELKEAHKKEHQEEEKDHHHSPINHNCSSQLPIDLAFEIFQINLPKISESIKAKPNFYYQDLFSSFEKQKIFQPPRLA